MLIFMIIVFCLVFFHNTSNVVQACSTSSSELVEYDGVVEHVFTHCLLSQPAYALSKNNSMAKDYDRDCITTNEFCEILSELYKNNYCLINPNKIFCSSSKGVSKTSFLFPKGKKPLIFSFDDVNYDTKKLGKGMVDKLVINDSGKLATSTKMGDKIVISQTNEFVPILESFISLHPDFSFENAKGMLCFTGYDGILGYRTNRDSPNRESEIENVKPVINKLKENGWSFACHSYGHYHMTAITDEKFISDTNKWLSEVAPLIGGSSIYVYPYGEWEILNNKSISKKHDFLVSNGFMLFCGVGMRPYLAYKPAPNGNQILFMDRKVIDGFSLRNRKSYFQGMFDANTVFDYKNRNQ